MKTTLEEISPVKKKLLIEIDASEVSKKLNQAYGDIRKRVRIPGFRPGKAPRKILESYYGNQVRDDVTKDLISESFPKAVDEVKTFPLGQPVLEKNSLKETLVAVFVTMTIISFYHNYLKFLAYFGTSKVDTST